MRKTFLIILFFLVGGFRKISGEKSSGFLSRRQIFIGIAIISLLKFSTSCRSHIHKCYVQVADPQIFEQSDTTKIQ